MSKQNNAAKSSEIFTPEVGQVIVAKAGQKRAQLPGKIIEVMDSGVRVLHGSGRPRFMASKTLRNKYYLAPDDVAATFTVAASVDSSPPVIGTEDATPRKANDEEPKSEPPPPPAANDAGALVKPILDLLQRQRDDELAEIKKRLDREEQARREDIKAIHATVETLAKIVASKQVELPAMSAADAERNAKAERDAQLKARHKAEFKDLLIEFTLAEFDRVDIGNRAGQERALESGEVYKLFAAWCERNKKHSERPYQHAIFSLLDNHPHRSDRKVIKRDKVDKVLTEYVPKNRKQTALPFTDPPPGVLKSLTALTDARQIFDIARGKVWPDISTSHIPTIQRILEAGEFTKADVLAAIHAVSAPIAGSEHRYTPAEILTPASIRLLVQRESTKAKVSR